MSEKGNPIAQDADWRTRINGEINSQQNFEAEWGPCLPGKVPVTIEEKIALKKKQLEELKRKQMQNEFMTTNKVFQSKTETLEKFGVRDFSKTTAKDLMSGIKNPSAALK
eukprot:TRINITY_DN26317_c0_g2_i1.p1 TRINITY_DN26317_c0_g2~~TRINITY_DN26317_c0_g2_i1.p1  ORF type:complete len:110 (-),score=28.07 TRINITY_DN26317_c0_g2_i1:278-607(-)